MSHQGHIVTGEMTKQELDGVSGGKSSLQAIINQQEKLAQQAKSQHNAAQDRYNAAKNTLNKIMGIYSAITTYYK